MKKPSIFYKSDIRGNESVRKISSQNNFIATIHFAKSKAISESVSKPLRYYNNIDLVNDAWDWQL